MHFDVCSDHIAWDEVTRCPSYFTYLVVMFVIVIFISVNFYIDSGCVNSIRGDYDANVLSGRTMFYFFTFNVCARTKTKCVFEVYLGM